VLVAASLYISKRRVNLAGLGIGVVSHRRHFVIMARVVSCNLLVLIRIVSSGRVLSLTRTLSSSQFSVATLGMSDALHTPRCCVCVLLQDFLQILSMFSNMDFAWPAALLSLYRGLSLVNFNLELLAPECSFAVNFEQKWFVTQLLPLILGASILLVLAATKALQWSQRVLFKVLPFGATMDTSLVDVCIGIFITGVYHLYLCELAISLACLLCS
jgi:hypothetical protein